MTDFEMSQMENLMLETTELMMLAARSILKHGRSKQSIALAKKGILSANKYRAIYLSEKGSTL